MNAGLRIMFGLGMLGLLVAGLVAISCTQPGGGTEARDIEKVPEPARHAIQSKHLQKIMNDMNLEVAKTWPQEIQDQKEALTERQRQDQFRKVAHLAEAMSEASASIPEAVADAKMSPTERREFDELVRQFQFQAAELSSAAKAQREDAMNTVLGRLKTTCSECHNQFSHVIPQISLP